MRFYQFVLEKNVIWIEQGISMYVCLLKYYRFEPCHLTSSEHVGNVTGCHAGYQEVIMCRTRGGSAGIACRQESVQAISTLTLKPRADVTRSPKHVSSKN